MSKINDLIKELCPNGVPYKEIKELCHVTRGRVISKNELRENEGEYPVYSSQTLMMVFLEKLILMILMVNMSNGQPMVLMRDQSFIEMGNFQ